MAGGGTGGHVMPLLAVARELRARGHQSVFFGTARGLEAKLVPAAGFPLEWLDIGGWNRVSPAQRLQTLFQLPVSLWQASRALARRRVRAVFSLGGYVAGPVMLAALWARLPVVVMEPNAIPGAAHRWFARYVARALVSFPEAVRYFPPERTEISGLPVRAEFFALPPKPAGEILSVLITGGSQGSRTLNRAARDAWPLLAGQPVRLIHQTGPAAAAEMAAAFAASGLAGAVHAFLEDMPAAFAAADLIVSRAGAGAVAEIAAAGKPSILIPFPFAADDHQRRNAEALAAPGAARTFPDAAWTGERFAHEILDLAAHREELARMSAAVRAFARPGAAARAADVLEELARRGGRP
jgi:UDP-N-acetylglucosamine--N-acetylmuramyl-(pentapeptide) pyrophosphoryl-undecaprenol N-acetylglucosamine transferase